MSAAASPAGGPPAAPRPGPGEAAAAAAAATDAWTAQARAFAQDAGAPQWLQLLRRRGAERFAALAWPTRRDAAWQHTDVGAVRDHSFVTAPPHLAAADDPGLEAVAAALPAAASPDGPRLIFVNGHFCAALSRLEAHGGIEVVPLAAADAAAQQRCVAPWLGRCGGHEAHVFNALNTALVQDGAAIVVAAGQAPPPVELVFVARRTQLAWMAHPRVVLVAQAGSRAVLLERHVACEGGGAALINAVTEIVVADGATVDHAVLQAQGDSALQLSQLHAEVGADAALRSLVVSTGGALARHEGHVRLRGRGGHCALRGVAVGTASAHRDFQVVVAHEAPGCTSEQQFRGVYDGHARGVFYGRVRVPRIAQKTAARQLSKSLLLSPQACAHSRPELEVLADDVRCNHGATVGQLDPEALFYLRSRGLGPEAARHMLVLAFAGSVLREVEAPLLRAPGEAQLRAALGDVAAPEAVLQ